MLIPAGLLINYLGVRLALHFAWPLFLDSIGTIFAAALGGYLPGITVGFLSNVINGIADPITIYYSIVSVMIAASATHFSERGVFTHAGRSLLSVLWFALIGGGVGSVLTWLLYGYSFGSGISAPFALQLYETFPLSQFAAQLTADLGIDLADKLITVALVFVMLKVLPRGVKQSMPLGSLYLSDGRDWKQAVAEMRKQPFYRKRSLQNEVVMLLIGVAVVLGSVAIIISFSIYRNTLIDRFSSTVSGVTALMDEAIDNDRISAYLDYDGMTGEYQAAETRLQAIQRSMADIKYMYVYQITPEGCTVVFDLDTPELVGESLGSVVPHDASFTAYLDDLLAGRAIEPIISNDRYGHLLSVYRPLYDSAGNCVAYAGADVLMDDILVDQLEFIIRILALLTGVTILIVVCTIWFAQKRIVQPINSIAKVADEFAYNSEQERVKSNERIRSLNIRTGDEIENLYHAFAKTVSDMMAYMRSVNEQSAVIEQMQHSIILSFANMVESRDENTGEHIKHTAAYVRLIAQRLRENPLYGEIMTDDYIDSLVRSAPLHDIGKITISDVLLNKPGRLTPEEFEIMKTHTTAGRRILHGTIENIAVSGYFSEAADLATYHHEKWNGTGYPEGLSGAAIPLSARIMAVADVFDALISRRCYKEPMPFDTAVTIIRAEAGAGLDPDVTAAFLAALDDIRAARQPEASGA